MSVLPASPPELNGSKSSSQSSSFRSSVDRERISVIAGNEVEVANFEDITLRDDQDAEDYAFREPATKTGGWWSTATKTNNIKKATLPNGLPARLAGTATRLPPVLSTMMMMEGPRRSSYPIPKEPSAGGAQLDRRGSAPNVPYRGNGHQQEKRIVRPSTSSLSATANGPSKIRSMSSSPTPPTERYSRRSPLLLSSSGPSSNRLDPTMRRPARRSSWQPNQHRKSVQELEAEYHDSDDDVPTDAIFWNVPISPRPLEEQQRASTFPSGVTTPATSPGRPETRSVSCDPRESSAVVTPAVVQASQMSVNFPRRSSSIRSSDGRSATSPHSMISHLTRATTMPANGSNMLGNGLEVSGEHHQHHRNSRTITWSSALADLSEETKHLTEALQEHAMLKQQREEEELQTGGKAERRLSEKNRSREISRRTSPTLIELPPVQKSNVTIDPLPISKEKEAVLTRTRPSWLPPKSREEEKRHLKEYQRMMARSLEADRKKAEREERSRRIRDDTRISILRIWDHHVLPNWDQVIHEPRTRELWWRGIAPRSRGVVWQRAVRNDLSLTENSYRAALKRAKDAERELMKKKTNTTTQSSMSMGGSPTQQREGDWFNAIKRDAHTTFPELRIFQPEGPLHDSLVDVLMAYAMYRSDVGYIYGTHLIAGLLLLNLPPPQAFLVLSNLLNHSIPLAFHTSDPSGIHQTYTLTLQALAYKFPDLHQHLTSTLKLPPETYLEPMFRTLFTRTLPLDHASRVWDVYVFEGDRFLVRTAVAVLGRLEHTLYGNREEVLGILGWGNKEVDGNGIGRDIRRGSNGNGNARCNVGDEEEFMLAVRSAGKE
ncbi:MAG: hypothetical protein M1823_004169 [Watsoniomyces obsoletus]|nr:MAG: hypothetical protein M1823_004169 [Watsoniomyces obsoletus]